MHCFADCVQLWERHGTPCAKRTTRSQADLHTDLCGCAARADERTAGGKNFADLGSVDSTRISGTLLSPRLNHYGS
jgi:hypothetical protein